MSLPGTLQSEEFQFGSPRFAIRRAIREMGSLALRRRGRGARRGTEAAPVLIDCLFGTGLARPLRRGCQLANFEACEAARVRVACDLPSGVDSDSGELLNEVPEFDLTVTFGALKPAHRLMPAMQRCGRVVLADIGVASGIGWHEIGRPFLPELDPAGHKYDRGWCIASPAYARRDRPCSDRRGALGAGYVRISTSREIHGLPSAVVQTDKAEINDERIGCLLVGPGMGDIPQLLTLALTSRAPKVIDADAIGQVGEPERLRGQNAILTPTRASSGKLFGTLEGSKAERALEAARQSDSVIVYKGPDTLVAAPDGRLGFAPPAPAWLATAGTGDVLAGMIAAMVARGMPPFEAACAAVWLHGRAAELAGPDMIADDLLASIPAALDLA
jgi:ADP-dependent NAD(P)H-hydrate dehydratase / NAD(P)H-hydrate epimerase